SAQDSHNQRLMHPMGARDSGKSNTCLWRANEAVIDTVLAAVASHNRAAVVDAGWTGVDRPRRIEDGDRSIGGPYETVIDRTIGANPRNLAARVYREGKGQCRSGRIERRDRPVAGADEAMLIATFDIVSGDRAAAVDRVSGCTRRFARGEGF